MIRYKVGCRGVVEVRLLGYRGVTGVVEVRLGVMVWCSDVR